MTSFRPRAAGFSLIELLVVIAMVAILSSLAAPSFQRTMAQRRVSETASDLMIALLQARNAAITNNEPAIVQPTSASDWSRGWRIYIDTDRDGAYTAGTDTLIANASARSTDISTYERSPSSLAQIGFDSTGYLISRDAGRVVFSSSAIPSSEYRRGIVVSRVGRVRMCESSRIKTECSGSE